MQPFDYMLPNSAREARFYFVVFCFSFNKTETTLPRPLKTETELSLFWWEWLKTKSRVDSWLTLTDVLKTKSEGYYAGTVGKSWFESLEWLTLCCLLSFPFFFSFTMLKESKNMTIAFISTPNTNIIYEGNHHQLCSVHLHPAADLQQSFGG